MSEHKLTKREEQLYKENTRLRNFAEWCRSDEFDVRHVIRDATYALGEQNE